MQRSYERHGALKRDRMKRGDRPARDALDGRQRIQHMERPD